MNSGTKHEGVDVPVFLVGIVCLMMIVLAALLDAVIVDKYSTGIEWAMTVTFVSVVVFSVIDVALSYYGLTSFRGKIFVLIVALQIVAIDAVLLIWHDISTEAAVNVAVVTLLFIATGLIFRTFLVPVDALLRSVKGFTWTGSLMDATLISYIVGDVVKEYGEDFILRMLRREIRESVDWGTQVTLTHLNTRRLHPDFQAMKLDDTYVMLSVRGERVVVVFLPVDGRVVKFGRGAKYEQELRYALHGKLGMLPLKRPYEGDEVFSKIEDAFGRFIEPADWAGKMAALKSWIYRQQLPLALFAGFILLVLMAFTPILSSTPPLENTLGNMLALAMFSSLFGIVVKSLMDKRSGGK